MPEYNPLYDANLRHFFGTKSVRSTLFRLGMVDRAGRVIDADQHKGKLHIIEQEFANVEREEEERRKEEAEIRRRVRVKRHEAIERAQQLERLRKIREDRRIRSEIVRIARGELMRSSLAPTAQSASRMRASEAAYRVDAFGPATQPRATDQVPMGDAGALVWGQALPLPLAESAASAGAGVTTPLLLELVIPREFSAHDVAASVTVHLPLGDMLSGAAAPSTDPEDVLMAPPRARSLAEELAGGGRDGGSAAPLPEPSGPLARLRVAWHIEEAEP
ncbi:hypothetical protein FNF29_01017 [Cafeteria roenbergensis]|nr:hypothetical protein FNF29_01017 [Cafeteria roenbergensis]|eukprot:KAA0156227.1 hypothetical protein FNF29_01017 [Cafeteria roenbergensis]